MQTSDNHTSQEPTPLPTQETVGLRDRIPELLLLAVLVLAASLRFVGINWDEQTHLHPDERFLTMVETSIQLPTSISDYFNTETSKFNPHNVGHGFFVYGTLPIFIVRYVGDWVGKTGYGEIHLVGRSLSAISDLVSIVLIYLIGARLYRRRVGLLAALFVALSVLLIQHAHFFVVDSMANAFILAGFYFAVRALDEGKLSDYLLFGLVLGMSVASKISVAPLAGVIVLAAIVRFWQTEPENRENRFVRIVLYLIAAALVSLVVFRIAQPYAFSGPTLFHVRLNPKWIANMEEIRSMNKGNTDAPYALQWAERTPVLFSLKNLLLWGMGLPLGIIAWVGWVLAVVEMVRGRWRRHLLPVIWTGAHFLWQSIGFTPAMRYQMPIYPTLALMAAWGLWHAWDWAGSVRLRWRRPARMTVALIAAITILGTTAWALAFSNIYRQTFTRVAASRWIYSHIPGVVNLMVDNDGEELLEPVPMPQNFVLTSTESYTASFTSYLEGDTDAILLPFVRDLGSEYGSIILALKIHASPDASESLATANYSGELPASGEASLELTLEPPLDISAGETYTMRMDLITEEMVRLNGEFRLEVQTGEVREELRVSLPQDDFALSNAASLPLTFTSNLDGTLYAVLLPDLSIVPSEIEVSRSFHIEVKLDPADETPLATASFSGFLSTTEETRLELALDTPLHIEAEKNYFLIFHLTEGTITMRGSAIVHETTWDDGMPWGVDGRGMNGRYIGLNQELYWHDDQDDDENGVADKLERIARTLTEGDYLIISSNRQYGTITRVPIRYPLTIAYYRALFDCPEPQDILRCAAFAQPGEIEGDLGYELIEVFQSNPKLGTWEVNDQGAEETFTVYDHPKVLVFKKAGDYSEEIVRHILEQVDLSHVEHVLPKDVSSIEIPSDLMLPTERWEAQQGAGTWSDLFNRNSLINRSQIIGVAVWWILIGFVGLLAFPITRVAFPGLRDGGYPLARVVGLLIVAWGTWILGSLGVPITPAIIFLILLAMAALSLVIAWRDREELVAYLHSHWREIVWTEVIALSFFLFDMVIRIGNPDLWHPAKGGEKPMDFSYLNAVIKSRTFPPYDPWFAGGYINYYYFGFVIVGMPIKLLGIVPTVAYNLVIPTLFSLLALTAYSVGYNLVAWFRDVMDSIRRPNPRLAGIAAALALVVLGNLGTARMVYDGLKRIGTPEGSETAGWVVGITQAMRGLGRFLTLEQQLPYALDHWYWNPSRSIQPGPGEVGPITEFPFFTFLYADLHAHMISRPLTVLAIAWGLSWLLAAKQRKRRQWPDVALVLIIGGMVFGAIGPTNMADYPVYWVLGVVAVIYATWLRYQRFNVRSVIEAVLMVIALMGLAQFLYQPFHQWYGQGYTALDIWEGSRTALVDYLTVHGLFLFMVVSWMIWETYKWMAATPLSSLKRLQPVVGPIAVCALGLAALTVLLVIQGYSVAMLAIPLMAWAGILLLRPGLAVEKRVVLALVGVAIALTFLVEVVVVRGTIGRMNTVFKFYLQVWDMFSLAAGGALAWVIADLPAWHRVWRRGWSLALGVLVFSAALYPLTAAPAKMRDRMTKEAPHTLDGMAFMPYVDNYYDLGQLLSLDEDYRAINWMQDNIQGSPVIVEANIPEYRWGSRFTIYTGLPGVLGWNNHQRQQRVTARPGVVEERALDILDFYLTRSIEEALDFLDRYEVQYVILGSLERTFYEEVHPCLPTGDGEGVTCDLRGRPWGMPTPDVSPSECEPIEPGAEEGDLVCPTYGLEKFETMFVSGFLKEVYRDGETVIYEVIR